jgi:hypothetical protein
MAVVGAWLLRGCVRLSYRRWPSVKFATTATPKEPFSATSSVRYHAVWYKYILYGQWYGSGKQVDIAR